MPRTAKPRSSAFDRHPRLALAGILLLDYVAVTILSFRGIGLREDPQPGAHTSANVVFALVMPVVSVVSVAFGWRREWRLIGLSRLDDWWTVTRCLKRGHAPAEARLWWAADEPARRRSRYLPWQAALPSAVLLLITVIVLRGDGFDRVLSGISVAPSGRWRC